ncbi:MAG: VWA domain-containing protein [Oscillospiraceae bacterium]|nr:VWA domain-containing protein [Oscillospiraceae bacterium]
MKHTFLKKTLSLVLCLVMLLGDFTGLMATAWGLTVEETDLVGNNYAKKDSDPATVNDWENYFGPDVKNTANAGLVWTDKSVFETVDAYVNATNEAEGSGFGLTMNDSDDFLVALSAMASTESITGYNYHPTDTMFVLDLSGSMSGNATTMIREANRAIDRILKLNPYNRVGVVLYSGKSTVGTSEPSSATMLLPLDRYTTTTTNNNGTRYDTSDDYLQYLSISSGSVSADRTLRNSSDSRPDESKSVIGGTYIQNGLYQAMGEFTDAAEKGEHIISGSDAFAQAGTIKIPILVLMSDGQPTAATTAFSNVGNSTMGCGSENAPQQLQASMSFFTQLTAAYTKQQIEEAYGTSSRFYTLGLGVDNNNYARAVLDPGSYTVTDSLWNGYNTANVGGSFSYPYANYTIDRNNRLSWGSVTNRNATKTVDVSNYRYYATEYFGASSGAQLQAAFESIVEQIILQSMYYPTHLGGATVDWGGFLTFKDYIGTDMEVKEIKGFQLGSTLFTGEKLAKAIVSGDMGTIDQPTDLGNNLVWAIIDRLNLYKVTNNNHAEAVVLARDIIRQAWGAGQLAWSQDDFSHHISWFSDADGTYLGFWDGSEEALAANTEASYAVTSYFFKDEVGTGHRETDMLYASVQVREALKDSSSTSITANAGDQLVVCSLPASLIPLYEYDISIDGTDLTKPTDITGKGADSPIRLIYEVGLSSDVDLLNMSETAETTADIAGVYTFYTNEWNKSWENDPSHNDHDHDPATMGENTTAFFEPSLDNEYYYYAQNTLIYTDTNGTRYAGSTAPSTSGTYYRRYGVYTDNNGSFSHSWVYERISEHALETAISVTSGNETFWYIPRGMIHHTVSKYSANKTSNPTGTVSYSDHPFIHHIRGDQNEIIDFHVDSILGNNGKLTVTPPTGIKISKTADSTITDRTQSYEFEVAAPAGSYQMILEQANGTRTESTLTVASNTPADIFLKHGETVYLLGLADGASVTVKELTAGKDYTVSKINGAADADGAITLTVAQHVIVPAAFENTRRTTGDLSVSKFVISTHDEHKAGNTAPSFGFEIEVVSDKINDGDTFKTSNAAITLTAVEDGGNLYLKNGSDNIALKHGETLVVYELPEGTNVTVTEIDTPNDGFAAENDGWNKTTTIVATQTSSVSFTNIYKPASTQGSTDLSVTIKKYLKVDTPFDGTFQFELQQWNGQGWTPAQGQGTPSTSIQFDSDAINSSTPNETGTINFRLPSLDAAGTYYFRVVEVVPDSPKPGVLYDTVPAVFAVDVTDNLAGELYVSNVRAISSNAKISDPALIKANKVVTKASFTTYFYNEYLSDGAAEIVLHIDKLIEGLSKAGFRFALYEADSSYNIIKQTPIATSGTTGADGDAVLRMIYDQAAVSTTDGKTTQTYHYVLEEIRNTITGIPSDNLEYSEQAYPVTVEVTTVTVGNATRFAEINVSVKIDDNTTYTASDSILYAPVVEKTENGFKLSNANGQNTSLLYNFIDDDKFFETATGEVTTTSDMIIVKAVEKNGSGAVVRESGTIQVVHNNDSLTRTVVESNHEVLIAELDIDNGITFTNKFTPDPVKLAVPITGTKTLTGRGWGNTVFTFELYEADANGNLKVNDGETAAQYDAFTTRSGSDGEFSFSVDEPVLTFSSAGDYYFVIKEKNDQVAGFTYDASEYLVKVTVSSDLSTGKLSAQLVSITKGGVNSPILFHNSYTATPAQIELTATKEMTNRKLQAGAYRFELVADDSTSTTETVVQVVGNHAPTSDEYSAAVTFPLTYDKAGTYHYIIREQLPDGLDANNWYMGYTFDPNEYEVTVTVTDVGGALTASAVYQNGSAPTFHNSYNPKPTSYTLSGTKTVEGHSIEDIYQFELYAATQSSDGTGAFVEGALLETVTNTGSSFTFRELNFVSAAGYRYIIKEKAALKDGVSVDYADRIVFDEKVYNVEIDVSDHDLDGVLSVQQIRVNGNPTDHNAVASAIAFTNVVDPAPITILGKAELEGLKDLSGRALKKDEFTFGLYRAQMSDLDGVIAIDEAAVLTATNNKKGEFVFNEDPNGYLTFTKPGTYYFLIREEAGDDSSIRYDETEYLLTVVVTTEEVQGVTTLKADLSLTSYVKEAANDGSVSVTTADAAQVEFHNEYIKEPDPKAVTFTVQKVMEGDSHSLKDFTFRVLGKDREPLAGYQSKENGKVTFTIEYNDSHIGQTFTYYLNEVDTGIKGMTYSTREYKIEVSVAKDDEGELVLTVLRDGAPATVEETFLFTNIYDKPEDPDEDPEEPKKPEKPENPDTGDAGDFLWLGMMLTGLFGFAATVTVWLRRRRAQH